MSDPAHQLLEEIRDELHQLRLLEVARARVDDGTPLSRAAVCRILHIDMRSTMMPLIKQKLVKTVPWTKAVEKAALGGQLSASHAVLLACIPAQFQEAALKKMLKGKDGDGPGELVRKLETRQLGKAVWFVLAEAVLDDEYQYEALPEHIVRRRLGQDPRTSDGSQDRDELRKKLSSMTAEPLCALVVEVLLLRGEEIWKLRRGEKGAIKELESILGVDEKKVAERVKAELAAAGKPGHVPPEPSAELPAKKKAASAKKGKKVARARILLQLHDDAEFFVNALEGCGDRAQIMGRGNVPVAERATTVNVHLAGEEMLKDASNSLRSGTVSHKGPPFRTRTVTPGSDLRNEVTRP